MRKLFALFLIILFMPANCLAFTTKKAVEAFDGKGYVGTLPDLSKSFKTTEPATAKPLYESTEKFHSANQVKPAPRDNPAFVNIILKTDKTSPYLNDLNAILPVIEKIYNCIENKEDTQKFVACTYFFNRTADYLREKYDGKPESHYISFKKLMALSTHTQSVALLRAEALKYNPYLAYSGAGYIYDPNNIDRQLEYLKYEIEDTIISIKDAN